MRISRSLRVIEQKTDAQIALYAKETHLQVVSLGHKWQIMKLKSHSGTQLRITIKAQSLK